MSNFHEFVSAILADREIDDSEVTLIRERLYEDGRLDIDDVKILVEMYCGADDYCTAFDDLFFSVLEEVFLADGQIDPSEQYYLLKLIYSDRVIRDREKQFLTKLKGTVDRTSPEFEALCSEAFQAHPTAWSVGGS